MNEEFIKAIFGPDAPWCHVTDFAYPPDDIPDGQHLHAWKGDYACRYQFGENTNQYFTISTFYCDEVQHARRRKALYRQTHCIVLDDVYEKLSIVEVGRLPSPSWVLETSRGSEQWGYILQSPCTDRSQVENLLDGLVANGLAPAGKDPGMKGVTRYVRLPDGINNKKSKGFFKCNLKTWNPFNRVTMQQLAAPFNVNLDAPRRESRIDGAANIADHPIMEHVHIKEIRSDGRYDITCPWVDEHTDGVDNGSAIFTNGDGSIGFKCHHGACQSRTGFDLLRHIDSVEPGFSQHMRAWQMTRALPAPVEKPAEVSFLLPAKVESKPEVSFLAPPVEEVKELEVLSPRSLMDDLKRERPSSKEAREIATQLLYLVDTLPKIDQKVWHDEVRDLMAWNAQSFKEILSDLRTKWYGEKRSEAEFYSDLIYVKELNQFYDHRTRIFYSAEAMQNSYSDQDAEARKEALQEGRVKKVDRLDYAPKLPRQFKEKGIVYGNMWDDSSHEPGIEGDCTPWLQHWDVLGWQQEKEHMLNWMAYTIQRPEHKINHCLLLGGIEGTGKDFLLYPLIKAMGENANVIGGEELFEGFNSYLMGTKYLHVNEIEAGDKREAKAVTQKLKPYLSAPPETLGVNEKGVKRVKIRNIVNVTMTTNSVEPVRLTGVNRRYYAVWSDFNPRDSRHNMLPQWSKYWEQRWKWMQDGGWQACVHELRTRDLSGFNPFAAPEVTEFLREIMEQSKSPLLQTIERFIAKRHGIFTCDLLTAQDMEDTMRAGNFFENEMLVDAKHITARRIGRELAQSGTYRQVRTTKLKMWVLRNPEDYALLPSGTVEAKYHVAINKARRDAPFSAVK